MDPGADGPLTGRPQIGGIRSSFAPWEAASATPLVRFEGVSRAFGETQAVSEVDLSIYEGEFFALLGRRAVGRPP